MRFKPRAIPTNYIRKKGKVGGWPIKRDGSEYQFHPLHVRLVSQVLPEVEAIHVLVDETKWVGLGRVHPHEWNHLYVPMVKQGPYVNFVAKPLRESRQ